MFAGMYTGESIQDLGAGHIWVKIPSLPLIAEGGGHLTLHISEFQVPSV